MRDCFDTLAQEIFSADIATDQKKAVRYFNSHGFHRLRWDASGNDDIRANRFVDANDPLIKNNTSLGPYERQLLYHMIRADCMLVHFVGYAGSGKSSTIRHVLQHYEKHRIWQWNKVATGDATPASLHVSVAARLNTLRPAYFYIDFNPICDSLNIFIRTASPRTKVIDYFLELWSERLPSAILDGLGRNAQSDDVALALPTLVEAIELGIRWSLNLEKPHARFKFSHAFFPANRVLRGQLSQSTPRETLAHVEQALLGLRAEQRIMFWHAVIDVIQLSAPLKPPLCLVCDNADPMDADIQQVMQEQLCTGISDCNYKILAPVRPAAHKARNFARLIEWYPHSGPNPLDILSLRLLSFVCSPDSYGAYQALQPMDRHRAVCAALELLLRLRRGRGQFRTLGTILLCAAGDSVRRILWLGHGLLTSNRLSTQFEISAGSQTLELIRRRYEIASYLERLATAIGEELVAIAHEEKLGDDEDRNEFTERLCARVMLTITTVTRNSTQIDRGALKQTRVGLLQNVLANKDVGGHSRQTIRDACIEALSESTRRGLRMEQAMAVLVAIADWLEKNAPQLLMSEWEDHGTCTALIQFLSDAMRGQAESARAEGDETEDFFWQDQQCRRLLAANKNYMYHETALYLPTTENLFRVGGRESDCKLFVLYTLALLERTEYTTGSLVQELRERGCDDATILSVVNELIAPERRLMWMDRSFYYPDFDALMSSAHKSIELSRAGYGYYTTLLSLAPYMLCCLAPAGVGANDGVSLPVRVEQCLRSLRALSDHQQQYWDQARGGVSVIRYVSGFDVALRVSVDVVATLKRYFARRRSASDVYGVLQTCRQTVYDWRKFLVAEAEAIRNATNVDMLEVPRSELRAAPGSIDPRRRSRASSWTAKDSILELERALSGPALWREDLQMDEFAPDRK